MRRVATSNHEGPRRKGFAGGGSEKHRPNRDFSTVIVVGYSTLARASSGANRRFLSHLVSTEGCRGCRLHQEEGCNRQPLAFVSKAVAATENRYSTLRREPLAAY